jgi:hypothetical protein
MNVHKDARLTPIGRERIVRQVVSWQMRRPLPKPQASVRTPFSGGLIDVGVKAWHDCVTAVPTPQA